MVLASWAWGAVVLAVVGFVVGVGLAQGLLELSPRGAGVEWAPAWALSASARVSWDWEAAGLGPLSWEFRAPVLLVWLHNPTGKWAQVALLAEYPPQAAPPLPLGSLGTTESQLLSLLTTWEPRILYSRGNATLATTPTPTQLLPPGTRVALLSPGATVLLEIPLHWGAPEKLHLCTPEDCTQLPLAPATTPPTPPQPQPWTPIPNGTDPEYVYYVNVSHTLVIDYDEGALIPHPSAGVEPSRDPDNPGACTTRFTGQWYPYPTLGWASAAGGRPVDPPPVRGTCVPSGLRVLNSKSFTFILDLRQDSPASTVPPLNLGVFAWGTWELEGADPKEWTWLPRSLSAGGLSWQVNAPPNYHDVTNPQRSSGDPFNQVDPLLSGWLTSLAREMGPCTTRHYTLITHITITRVTYQGDQRASGPEPATLREFLEALHNTTVANAYLHVSSLALWGSYKGSLEAPWLTATKPLNTTLYYYAPATGWSTAWTYTYPDITLGASGATANWDVWVAWEGNEWEIRDYPLPLEATEIRIETKLIREDPRPDNAWEYTTKPVTTPGGTAGEEYVGLNCPWGRGVEAWGGDILDPLFIDPVYRETMPPQAFGPIVAAIYTIVPET